MECSYRWLFDWVVPTECLTMLFGIKLTKVFLSFPLVSKSVPYFEGGECGISTPCLGRHVVVVGRRGAELNILK